METAIKLSPVNMEARKRLGIRAGDTVRVHTKIQEKGKTRIQVFEGMVLAVKHGTEPGATFTVRRTLSGVGVEKIFPLYSPSIDKIEIVKRSRVRRAKLYYIREKVAREVRRKLRRLVAVPAVMDENAKPEEEHHAVAGGDTAHASVAPATAQAQEERAVEADSTKDEATSEAPQEEKTASDVGTVKEESDGGASEEVNEAGRSEETAETEHVQEKK